MWIIKAVKLIIDKKEVFIEFFFSKKINLKIFFNFCYFHAETNNTDYSNRHMLNLINKHKFF